MNFSHQVGPRLDTVKIRVKVSKNVFRGISFRDGPGRTGLAHQKGKTFFICVKSGQKVVFVKTIDGELKRFGESRPEGEDTPFNQKQLFDVKLRRKLHGKIRPFQWIVSAAFKQGPDLRPSRIFLDAVHSKHHAGDFRRRTELFAHIGRQPVFEYLVPVIFIPAADQNPHTPKGLPAQTF